MKLLGISAVRMPYSMTDLFKATARDFHWEYCQNIRPIDLLKSVLNPGTKLPKGAYGLWCPFHLSCCEIRRNLKPETLRWSVSLSCCGIC
jgi:hypothetical protein